VKTFEGSLSGKGLKIGIVIARFNHFIGKELLAGALDCLTRHGVSEDDIDVAWVPGSFEIAFAASRLTASGRYSSVICLGVLIRGQTPHFDHLAAEATKGIAQADVSSGVPTCYGLITADTIEQAVERAGTKAGNKGWDAALAAIEMANLSSKLG